VNYDQRGWGESANAPGPYDLLRLADDAESVIAATVYTDYVLVGHSMGGKVAQVLAARRPAGLAADMTLLEGTGHLSPLEVPEQVADHITAFVMRLNR
jgi:pimeloyl-ACP methyl ester carboxylesterase